MFTSSTVILSDKFEEAKLQIHKPTLIKDTSYDDLLLILVWNLQTSDRANCQGSAWETPRNMSLRPYFAIRIKTQAIDVTVVQQRRNSLFRTGIQSCKSKTDDTSGDDSPMVVQRRQFADRHRQSCSLRNGFYASQYVGVTFLCIQIVLRTMYRFDSCTLFDGSQTQLNVKACESSVRAISRCA